MEAKGHSVDVVDAEGCLEVDSPFSVAIEIDETAKDGLAVVNNHSESRVTGLEVRCDNYSG